MEMRATWKFDVFDDRGEVVTKWSVWSDEGDSLYTESDSGEVRGPLHTAIFAAYDAMGLTCPLVLDPDLLKWGGHSGLD